MIEKSLLSEKGGKVNANDQSRRIIKVYPDINVWTEKNMCTQGSLMTPIRDSTQRNGPKASGVLMSFAK